MDNIFPFPVTCYITNVHDALLLFAGTTRDEFWDFRNEIVSIIEGETFETTAPMLLDVFVNNNVTFNAEMPKCMQDSGYDPKSFLVKWMFQVPMHMKGDEIERIIASKVKHPDTLYYVMNKDL